MRARLQVVDARDPLRYWSPDLEAYAGELRPSKPSLMLLNKADLLPHHVRARWADHLDACGIDYLFWSAKAASAAASAVQGGLPRLLSAAVRAPPALRGHGTGPRATGQACRKDRASGSASS